MKNKTFISFINQLEKDAGFGQAFGKMLGGGVANALGAVAKTVKGAVNLPGELAGGIKSGFTSKITSKSRLASPGFNSASSAATPIAPQNPQAMNDLRSRMQSAPIGNASQPPPGISHAPIEPVPAATPINPAAAPVNPAAAPINRNTAASNSSEPRTSYYRGDAGKVDIATERARKLAAMQKNRPANPWASTAKAVGGGALVTGGIIGGGTLWGGLTQEPGMSSYYSGEGPSAQGPTYG